MAQGIRAWTVALMAPANEGDMIQAKQRRRETAFWKQDVLVILAIALYLALAFGVVQIWSILSHQGDAFAGSVLRINDEKK